MTQNTYLMLMHLSQLVGFAAPVLGLLAPILMWALNKDKHPEVDAQGKIILNWIISVFIYAIVSVLLCFILVGIPILLALLVLDIVFPIMGAVKANDGIRWKYPLSIPFFKVEERHG